MHVWQPSSFPFPISSPDRQLRIPFPSLCEYEIQALSKRNCCRKVTTQYIAVIPKMNKNERFDGSDTEFLAHLGARPYLILDGRFAVNW